MVLLLDGSTVKFWGYQAHPEYRTGTDLGDPDSLMILLNMRSECEEQSKLAEQEK